MKNFTVYSVRIGIIILCASFFLRALDNDLSAATIVESAMLGPTGISPVDAFSGVVPGSNIKDSVFFGVRFELSQPVLTTQIGGHFVSDTIGGGTFFASLVELTDETDLPNSEDLSSSDFIGATVLEFPEPSAEVFGNLALPLSPGWYAMVFGGGLFGASAPGFGTVGAGAAIGNGEEIGTPSYIGWQPTSGWLDFGAFDDDSLGLRFVLLGSVVPEPSTNLIVLSLLFLQLARKR